MPPPNQTQAPQASPEQAPDQSQNQIPQQGGADHGLSQDELTAVLGYITTIGEHHMKSQMPPDAPQEAQNAPVEAPQAPDLTNEVEELKKHVEALQKQIKKDPKDDLAEIRKQVEQALAEDDNHEQK